MPPPPTCFVCHATNAMRIFDEHLLASFQIRICNVCKHKDSKRWKEMTTTNAKKKYLVSDNILRQLPFVEKSNPRNPHFRPMKLYLTHHVEEASLRIWETMEKLEEEIIARAKRKQATKDARGRGSFKRLKKTLVRGDIEKERPVHDAFQLKPTGVFAQGGLLSGAGAIVADRVTMSSGHRHSFGPLTLDETTGMHTKRCPCGFTQEVELM